MSDHAVARATSPRVTPDTRLVLDQAQHDALLDWLEARRNKPENPDPPVPSARSGGGWTGGFDMLVSIRDWTGHIDPVWVAFSRIAPGTAAVYPYKGRIPDFNDPRGLSDRGEGQWKRSEILAVRVWLPVHPDFAEVVPSLRAFIHA